MKWITISIQGLVMLAMPSLDASVVLVALNFVESSEKFKLELGSCVFNLRPT